MESKKIILDYYKKNKEDLLKYFREYIRLGTKARYIEKIVMIKSNYFIIKYDKIEDKIISINSGPLVFNLFEIDHIIVLENEINLKL